MEKLIDISAFPVADVLDVLLCDKSTKNNIIWATDTYEEYGEHFADTEQITINSLYSHSGIILPRIRKSQEAQSERTRKKAEVFTPAWLCNKMNNHADTDWFGRKNVFNTEHDDHTWSVTEGKIEFPKRKHWQRYVDSRRLEITCGEAPYLVSRYDVSTGDVIFPLTRRIGILDRKMRIVNENTSDYADWLKWTIRAFESCYGYEYQGDNVLIARINMLLTFADYYEDHWRRPPEKKLLLHIAGKIAWNIWQMDGLKDTVPLGKPYEEFHQPTLFDMLSPADNSDAAPPAAPCKIYNWRSASSLNFKDTKEIWNMGKKLFDYVIGNPPYQDENAENNRQPPVYDKFIDATYPIGEHVLLIHPARFLFDAGQTSSAWNQKMLNDKHLKVLYYEQDSSKLFSNTDIKGGIAITYHNANEEYQPIEFFTVYPALNSIIRKVKACNFTSLSKYIYAKSTYKFTEKMHNDYPEAKNILSEPNVIGSDIFDRMPNLFTDKINDIYIW